MSKILPTPNLWTIVWNICCVFHKLTHVWFFSPHILDSLWSPRAHFLSGWPFKWRSWLYMFSSAYIRKHNFTRFTQTSSLLKSNCCTVIFINLTVYYIMLHVKKINKCVFAWRYVEAQLRFSSFLFPVCRCALPGGERRGSDNFWPESNMRGVPWCRTPCDGCFDTTCLF